MLSTSLEVQFLNKAKQDLGGKTNIFLGCRMCIWSKEAKVVLKKNLLNELSQRLIGSCFVRDALRRPYDALQGIDRCHNRKDCDFPLSM